MAINKRSERFKPIHHIAQQRENVAAQTFGKVQKELFNHNSRLMELMQYHEDYQTRFAQGAVEGMSVVQVQSYQKFISQLKVAIIEQKKQISRIADACDSSRSNWHKQRQKSQVLENVIDRYQKQELKQENKKEQRDLDEMVTNRFWHLKHQS